MYSARFPLPELTARVDGWPVSITRQHGPCWRPVNSASGVTGELPRWYCDESSGDWQLLLIIVILLVAEMLRDGRMAQSDTSRAFDEFLACSCWVRISSQHIRRLNEQYRRFFNTCQRWRHVLLQDGIFAVINCLISDLHTSVTIRGPWPVIQRFQVTSFKTNF